MARDSSATDWRVVRSGDASDRWHEVRGWVTWYVARFLLDHRVVPPCWYLQGATVDVLTALRDAHVAAYSPSNPDGRQALDWQRTLRDVESRLRDLTASAGCNGSAHHEVTPIVWPDDSEQWGQHIAADTNARLADEISRGDHLRAHPDSAHFDAPPPR